MCIISTKSRGRKPMFKRGRENINENIQAFHILKEKYRIPN